MFSRVFGQQWLTEQIDNSTAFSSAPQLVDAGRGRGWYLECGLERDKSVIDDWSCLSRLMDGTFTRRYFWTEP